MRIVKIEIKEFGKLRNMTLDLSEGLTVIEGENEAGKSTLLLFIKFMLYGIAKKTRATSVSEAERALNRDSESASGSMTVSHLGKLYRIDRKLHKTARSLVDKLQVTDCETALPVDVKNSPGEFFLGIPSEVFESSCSVSQLSNTSIKGESIGYAMQNLISSADETVDIQKTVKLLESARVKYLHKDSKGGSIYELESQKELLEERYAKAVEDSCETDRLNAEIIKLDAKIAEVSERQHKADELFSKINLRTVIMLFDKLHIYEKELDENNKKLKASTESITKNGITPDRSFLARLINIRNELELSRNEYDKACDKQNKLLEQGLKNNKDNEELNKVSKLGGKDALEQKFSALTKKAKKNVTFAVFFGVITVLATAGAVISALPIFFTTLPLFEISLCAAVFSLVLSVLTLSMRTKARKELNNLCALLGISLSNIDRYFADIEAAAARMEELNDSLSKCEAEKTIRRQLLDNSFSKLDAILSPYLKVDLIDKNTAVNSLENLIENISHYCDEKEKTLGTIASLESKIRDLSSELTEYNEHQVRRKVSKEILSMSENEIQQAKKEKSYYDLQLKALNDKRLLYERSLLERKYSTQNPFDVAARLEEANGKLEAQKKVYESIALAIDTVNTAGENIRKTLTPKLHLLANEYLSQMTGGKYDSLGINEKLELSMTEDGFAYSADAFSTGTKDIAYITLRLALLGALPCDELPPIFMDETLAMIDDRRTVNILFLLSDHCNRGGQCILFTCHDREANLCRTNGISHEKVTI